VTLSLSLAAEVPAASEVPGRTWAGLGHGARLELRPRILLPIPGPWDESRGAVPARGATLLQRLFSQMHRENAELYIAVNRADGFWKVVLKPGKIVSHLIFQWWFQRHF